MAVLPHALVSSRSSSTAPKTAYFLHGILGSGGNLRTLAKRVLERCEGEGEAWEIVLVDLPGHGRSVPMKAPFTLAACADAVRELAASLSKPISALVGHSFGGKVALVYAESDPELPVCCTLDSAPGPRPDHHGSESTLRVVGALRSLPEVFETRTAFDELLRHAGLDQNLIAWLALNVVAREGGGFRFRLDLDVIDALLNDYFARDCWPILERETTHFSVVIGGASGVWDGEDRARAETLSKQGHLAVTVIAGASHWLHVDALEPTADAVASSLLVR